MLMIVAAIALASQAPAQAHVQIAEAIQARGAEVTLGEAVDLRSLPESLRAAADLVVIARFEHRPSLTLSRQDFIARLRRRVPALGPWLNPVAPGSVTINFSDPPLADPSRRQASCVKLTRDIPRDTFLQPADFEPADCSAAPRQDAVYYDRTDGFSRARADLRQGEITLAPPPSTLSALATGKRLLLTVNVGPVSVQRTVSAVQPARPGAAVFVADQTGAVFRAPSPEVVQ